jgi:hypothetical protein
MSAFPNVKVVNPSAKPVQVSVVSGGGGGAQFPIGVFDYVAFTYYGSTNNVHTEVFKTGGSGGTTVATLTYGYTGGGAANDDTITSIAQT